MEFNIIEKSEKYKYSVGLSNDKKAKIFKSPNANYLFNLEDGQMLSWGQRFEDDPQRFPAPNILDCEISTICHGVNGKVCPFCYKANTPNGRNMSFETFKHILDVYPKSLTQVAFGADATLTSNPDLWKMAEYCRQNNIVPNITAAQIDDETADKLVKYMGAVAISVYEDKDVAYDSIKRLTDRGMTQVNIHLMIAQETFERAKQVLSDVKTDPRLEKLNAVVMLSLKKKGRGIGFHPLTQEQFNELVKYARENKIGIGFDSCSSLKAYNAFKDNPNVQNMIIPCESSLESSYINVDGEYFPCSFTEGIKDENTDWEKGISVLECNSVEEFLDKIWHNKKTLKFSDMLLHTCDKNEFKCRSCPLYNV